VSGFVLFCYVRDVQLNNSYLSSIAYEILSLFIKQCELLYSHFSEELLCVDCRRLPVSGRVRCTRASISSFYSYVADTALLSRSNRRFTRETVSISLAFLPR